MTERATMTPVQREAAKIRQPRGSVPPQQLAEVSATWERAIGSDPRDRVTPDRPRELADEDTLIEIHGTDSGIFVAKGDPLPVLETGPPPAPSAKAKRRKASRG